MKTRYLSLILVLIFILSACNLPTDSGNNNEAPSPTLENPSLPPEATATPIPPQHQFHQKHLSLRILPCPPLPLRPLYPSPGPRMQMLIAVLGMALNG